MRRFCKMERHNEMVAFIGEMEDTLNGLMEGEYDGVIPDDATEARQWYMDLLSTIGDEGSFFQSMSDEDRERLIPQMADTEEENKNIMISHLRLMITRLSRRYLTQDPEDVKENRDPMDGPGRGGPSAGVLPERREGLGRFARFSHL